MASLETRVLSQPCFRGWLQWCSGFFVSMANDERGDRSEFGPNTDAMRTMTVDVIDPLCGKQRRVRMSRTDYYLHVEPVLQRLEKEAGRG